MRISDWSSDVCSSDLFGRRHADRRRGLHDAQAGFGHRDLQLTPDWRRRRRNAKTADMTHALRCAARATPVLATLFLAIGPASAAEKRFGLTSFETIEVTADVMVEVVTRAPVSAVATGPQDALDRLSQIGRA